MNGIYLSTDRQWLIKTPQFNGRIYDYNWELTGYDPRLAELDKEFHYSGNAYYIIYTLAPRNGWEVQELEPLRMDAMG